VDLTQEEHHVVTDYTAYNWNSLSGSSGRGGRSKSKTRCQPGDDVAVAAAVDFWIGAGGNRCSAALKISPCNALRRFMRVLNFTVVMTPDVDGGYVVTCPALPGLVTEGDTLEEARSMAADAIQGYRESLRKHGEPIPTDQSIS